MRSRPMLCRLPLKQIGFGRLAEAEIRIPSIPICRDALQMPLRYAIRALFHAGRV
jgi:hypothetical protein